MNRLLLTYSNRHATNQILSSKAFSSISGAHTKSPPFLKSSEANLTTTNSAQFSTNLNPDNWSKILIKAEKVVGYPTSFLNLRYLVSDEVAHFANLLRKLMKTKHPLMKMARRFIMSSDKAESKRSLQVNGLIVLLISKAVGQPGVAHAQKSSSFFFSSDVSDGIHSSQRCLAEIAEMIYMGTVIHRGILDLKTVDLTDMKDMDQGNKLAVLCGDYLLANACNNLAKLRNTEVVDLMSQVISDISEGIFRRNAESTFLNQWLDNINSSSTSLLANSAKSAMLLVKNSSRLQEDAFNFAKQLDITHKIWSEFVKYKKNRSHILDRDGLFEAIYRDRYRLETSEKNSGEFNESILLDGREMFENHYSLAWKSLESLEANAHNADRSAIESLKSILDVMKKTI